MLDVYQLDKEFGGLSTAVCRFYGEAASVMLARHKHKSGEATITVRASARRSLMLSFRRPSQRATRSWKDIEEATEYGAAAVAMLLVPLFTAYTVVERSAKGAGFDYWLGERDLLPFEAAAKLEVSGIDEGRDSEIQARVREKRGRLTKYGTLGSAFVSVTEFHRPISILVRHDSRKA